MITREIKVGDWLRWIDDDEVTILFKVKRIEGDYLIDNEDDKWLVTPGNRLQYEHVDEPQAKQHSGSKYLRDIQLIDGKVDVYAMLVAFDVRCPARQHAIKKLLCAGLRGKGDELQDLHEAGDAIDRAIQIAEA
jgi:hypothetical protein